jgi:hypothetical protein
LKAKALALKEELKAKGVTPPSRSVLLASSRTGPLLVIHLLDFKLKAGEEPSRIDGKSPVATVSLVFPSTSLPCKERRYQASSTLVQLLAERREEAETDEELQDE